MDVKDIATGTFADETLKPRQGVTSDHTGTAVDISDEQGALVVIHLGDYTDGTHDFTIQHDDDDGNGNPAGNWADVPSDDLVGSVPTFDGGGKSNEAHVVGYIGLKEHLRVNSSQTGTSSGADYSVEIIRQKTRHEQP